MDGRVRILELTQSRTATSPIGLRRYIDEQRPVALIAHMTHANIAAIMATALARHRPRLIVVEHNRFDTAKRRRRGLVRLAYDLVPLAYRLADVIGVVADGMRERVATAPGLPRTVSRCCTTR